jgi:hypothetical protein
MSLAENRPVRSRAVTRQLWAERLQRFADSGLSVAAFCRRESVSCQACYYWKLKLLRHDHVPDADPPRLLPVRLKDAAPVEIALPNGCVLRLAPGCDLDFVRSVVGALGGEPC